MTTKEFCTEVSRIAGTSPTYRTGGTGRDGTCDCIGLVMGAMYALGHSEYPMHSSNYFARCEVDNLHRVDAMEDELQPGMLLFKARSDGNPRYDLHMRYRQGGRYFTGDLLDYYHVGVVTAVNPLEITHCTSTSQTDGISRDRTLDSWTHAGMVRGVDYREDDGGAEEEAVETAIVTAQSGSTVNLRVRPGEKASLVMRVPIGRRVTVLERASGWAHVQVDGTTGYMMEAFLASGDDSDAAAKDADMVTLQLPREAAMALYEAFTKVL